MRAPLALVLVALAAPPRASAQATVPYPPPGYAPWQPGEPDEDPLSGVDPTSWPVNRGWQARLAAGPGLMRVASTDAPTPTSFSGFAAALSIAAGARVLDHLLVFGELAAHSILAPRIGGLDPDRLPARISVTTLGLGGGLGYAFMPSNVTLSGAVLLSQIRTVDRDSRQLLARTVPGPALHLTANKDWPLTPGWALGLALRAHLAQLQDADRIGSAPWRSYGLTLALSALCH